MSSPAALPALLLLLAPLSALLVSFFVFYRLKPGWTHWPILASCAVVTGSAFALAWQVASGARLDWTLFRWIPVGALSLQFGLMADGLNASVLAMVALVGSLIHVYAVGYMHDDESFARFFLYFHLFFLSMLGLLLSNNYLQMYMFWEGVGVASYLLIGFWFERESARKAAFKAFLTNRVGDFGFMLAIVLLLGAAGTVHFGSLFEVLGSLSPRRLELAAFLLLWAATAKSAQFPLYFWLPDAMEGPTPTSALMHAATMVTAGVFLLLRSWPLISLVPRCMDAIAWIGLGTALLAGIVACVKNDLKRILAYSTVSHLGLMTLAVGLGAAGAAAFHLVVHGFFKALLFLCAGNMLHAIGKSSAGIEEVGGLRKKLPFTYWAFLAGALSLAGFFPFGGFFSKDRILDAAFHHGPVFAAGAGLIAVSSSFYIFRLFFMAFLGPRSRQKWPEGAHPHEGSAWMNAPVGALAVGAAVAGLFAPPFLKVLEAADPGKAFELEALNPMFSLLGLGLAGLGAGLAYLATTARPDFDWDWKVSRPGLYAFINGDFGWQALVSRGVVAPVAKLAGFTAGTWERVVWDPGVDSLAGLAKSLGDVLSRLTEGLVNEYLWWMLAGTALLVWSVR